MIKLEIETKKFNQDMQKFINVTTGIAPEIVVKKIAFDLLACILGGLPTANKGFGLSGKTVKYKGTVIPASEIITGRHPVDLGRARAGWYASARGLGFGFNWQKGVKIKKKGKQGIEKGKTEGSFKANFGGPFKSIEMVNNVRYINYLEYGWSKQAPAGMVRISMRKLRGVMPKVMNEEFLAKWNELKF